MIPCILMLISVGVGLVILVLFITSFLLTIFAWIIFGAKGVLWISVVSLLVLRMIFNCKREIDAAKEEEEHRRRAAAAEEARKERERQVEREKELRRLQEPFRQAELRQRQYMAENSLGEQQPPERTGPTSSMNTSRPPQRMGWFVNLIERIGRASSAVASISANHDIGSHGGYQLATGR